MNATGKRRLLKLADFLETKVPLNRFDMCHFAGAVADGRPACGTSACAAGWAATIPSFRAVGFRLINSRTMGIYPGLGRARGWAALEKFFVLNRMQVCELFDTHDPRTKTMNNLHSALAAAQRIRNLVAREQAAADAANKRRGRPKAA